MVHEESDVYSLSREKFFLSTLTLIKLAITYSTLVFGDEQDTFRLMQKSETDEEEKAKRIRKKYVEEEVSDRKKVVY